MERRWHWLKPNSRTTCPSSFVFVDTETCRDESRRSLNGVPHKLRLWYAIYVRLNGTKTHSRCECTGDTSESFWQWLYTRLSPRRQTWVFAHNLAFDMITLRFAAALKDGPLTVKTATWTGLIALEREASIIETKHKATNAKCVFLDTLNYWRCSLADIGCEIGKRKLRMPSQDADKRRWIAYCRRDAKIIESSVCCLVQSVRANDLGHMRYTAPAQGLQAYRHRFMRHRILIHNHAKSLDLERKAYYGGLTQVYRIGAVPGPVYVLDVQSFYPSIMAGCTLPYQWLGVVADRSNRSITDYLRYTWVIARVRLRGVHRPLPVRLGNRLVMANGNFTTTLHWPELINLNKCCRKWTIEYAVAYASDVLFKEYVHELWTIKRVADLAGKTVDSSCIKLILNGLHGKLGQRAAKWIDRRDLQHEDSWGQWHCIDTATGRHETYRAVNDLVQQKRLLGSSKVRPWCSREDGLETDPAINDEAQNSCPSIAGAITSWGRTFLQSLVDVAGQHNVYYVDTDCLHCSQDGYNALLSHGEVRENTLGALSLCGIYSSAEYLGPKAYRLDSQWTVAGRKAASTPIRNNCWQQSCFSGWPALLSAGINGEVTEWVQDCELAPQIDLARVNKSGWVSPIKLGVRSDDNRST